MDPRYLPDTRNGKIAHAIEEIGEVQEQAGRLLQALGKIARYGFRSTDPHTQVEYNNAQAALTALEYLCVELADLERALGRLHPELRAEA